MEERVACARLVVAVGQSVLGQSLLQGTQLRLGNVAGHLAVAEVGYDTGLEALVDGAVVVALAVGEVVTQLSATGIYGIFRGVGLEALFGLCHHRKAAFVAVLVRILQERCLDVVGRLLLALNHIKDVGGVELLGDKVLIDTTQTFHLLVGVDHALQQQCGGYGHIELVHRDVALQRGQRVVGTVAADGTFDAQTVFVMLLAIAQHTSGNGTALGVANGYRRPAFLHRLDVLLKPVLAGLHARHHLLGGQLAVTVGVSRTRGRAVAFVVGDDNQGALAEAGREQCQHVDFLKLALLAEVRGALLVGGDGAVATDDELRGLLVFSCEERYGPDHQFRQVFLRAVGDCTLVAQRDPAISV